MRSMLARKAARLGLLARVRFWGCRNDVHAIMRRTQVVALPSRRETFGLVALEALALGVPVVAFSAGGVADTLGENPGAQLVEAGDIHAFARCVESAVENGSPGPAEIEAYRADRIAQRWTRVYDTVVT
jgi:glycosyltransferase involved in cell wall biosynthesis